MAFLDAPLLGIGTANYRDLCADILAVGSAFRCDNHPHNFYIQMLAETGILGFVAGVFMISAMVIIAFFVLAASITKILSRQQPISYHLDCFFRCNQRLIFLDNGTIFFCGARWP